MADAWTYSTASARAFLDSVASDNEALCSVDRLLGLETSLQPPVRMMLGPAAYVQKQRSVPSGMQYLHPQAAAPQLGISPQFLRGGFTRQGPAAFRTASSAAKEQAVVMPSEQPQPKEQVPIAPKPMQPQQPQPQPQPKRPPTATTQQSPRKKPPQQKQKQQQKQQQPQLDLPERQVKPATSRPRPQPQLPPKPTPASRRRLPPKSVPVTGGALKPHHERQPSGSGTCTLHAINMAVGRAGVVSPAAAPKALRTSASGSWVNFDTLAETIQDATGHEFVLLPPVATNARQGSYPWAAIGKSAAKALMTAFRGVEEDLRWIVASGGHTWAVRTVHGRVWRLDSLAGAARDLGASSEPAARDGTHVLRGALLAFPLLRMTPESWRLGLAVLSDYLKRLHTRDIERIARDPAACAGIPMHTKALQNHIAGCIGALAWYLHAADRVLMAAIVRGLLHVSSAASPPPSREALADYNAMLQGQRAFDKATLVTALQRLAAIHA